MLLNFTNVAVSLLGAVATITASLPNPAIASNTQKNTLEDILSKITNQPIAVTTATPSVATSSKKEIKLICKDCSPHQLQTLNFLQEKGFKDKNAIAVMMGNIEQESTFVPNICEGGMRTSYRGCRSGGYGIIQWTSQDRYDGLGIHAARNGRDPSTLDAQLEYMLHERDWKMIEPQMLTPGKSIPEYMRLAQKWIRWGIHGARTHYAYNYANKLVYEEVEVPYRGSITEVATTK